MHKKFEINRTKIKGSCQLGRKVAPHDSKSDLPLVATSNVMCGGCVTAYIELKSWDSFATWVPPPIVTALAAERFAPSVMFTK